MFIDIFYPDNPKRRKEVDSLYSNARLAFIAFNSAWNEFAKEYTGMIEQIVLSESLSSNVRLTIPTVALNTETQTVKYMVEEINRVVTLARNNLDTFAKSVSSSLTGKELERFNLIIKNSDNGVRISSIINFVGGVAIIAATIGFGSYIISALGGMVAIPLVGLSVIFGGGIILAATGIVLLMGVVDAISGAIERSQLKDAISVLTQINDEITTPLQKMNTEIMGLTSQVKLGFYVITPDVLLRRINNKWIVIDLLPMAKSSTDVPMVATSSAYSDTGECTETIENDEVISTIRNNRMRQLKLVA